MSRLSDLFTTGRPRWWAVLVLAGVFVLSMPSAWPWILLGAVVLGLLPRLLLPISLARRARRIHAIVYGTFSATPSTFTYTHGEKTVSLQWEEIQSVAYCKDLLPEAYDDDLLPAVTEWQLRTSPGSRKALAVPDHPSSRQHLLECFARYLPEFNSNVCDEAVAGAASQNKDLVIECWKRRAVAPSPASSAIASDQNPVSRS